MSEKERHGEKKVNAGGLHIGIIFFMYAAIISLEVADY